MFERKYTPSIKRNNALRDKVVSEVRSFIYRIERGRFTSVADKDAIMKIVAGLKLSVEELENIVGTGEENIGAIAEKILSLLESLKKSVAHDMLHRIESTADELDYHMNMMKDMLYDGVGFDDEELGKDEKTSRLQGKLEDLLDELAKMKEYFFNASQRVEREIEALEKDAESIDDIIVNEENERKINELYGRVKSIRTKIDNLAVRKSAYDACYDILDMIYTTVSEMIKNGVYSDEELKKARVYLDMRKLKDLYNHPERALAILKLMQKDIDSLKLTDDQIRKRLEQMRTNSTVVSSSALSYKEELMRKKREKEQNAQKMKDIDNLNPAKNANNNSGKI